MPTAALHSAYWKSRASGPPPEAGASSDGGYIPWQTTVICASGFGAMQVVWDWAAKQAHDTWPRQDKAHGIVR